MKAYFVGGHRNGTFVEIPNADIRGINSTYMPNFCEVWNEEYERVGDTPTFVYVSESKEIDNIWER